MEDGIARVRVWVSGIDAPTLLLFVTMSATRAVIVLLFVVKSGVDAPIVLVLVSINAA